MAENDDEESKPGVNITVSGKTTDKIVSAMLDLFSPVTHVAGMLGDHIRLYRERSVERALEKAKQIAVAEHRTPELPPPKFLVPYLEAVSVEDEDDEALREKWARLLLNAGSKPDSLSYYAKTVLSELSSEEAAVLDNIVASEGVLERASYAEYAADHNMRCEQARSAAVKIIEQLNIGAIAPSEALVGIKSATTNLVVTKLSFKTTSEGWIKDEFGRVSFSVPALVAKRSSFEILQARKIIDAGVLGNVKLGDKIQFDGRHYFFTTLGFGVVRKLYKTASPTG